ncbi:MAG: hypothetical protein CM1200mP26_12910 [Acidimicrobiales bacterium]|nr:MAG: hypothetical protein CM1200mP26_12910 [Acidimicrobiales bacterium]
MGGIYSVRRATEELAPAIVAEVMAMDVDLALLVPVDRSATRPWVWSRERSRPLGFQRFPSPRLQHHGIGQSAAPRLL